MLSPFSVTRLNVAVVTAAVANAHLFIFAAMSLLFSKLLSRA